jgi:hypothetical protein
VLFDVEVAAVIVDDDMHIHPAPRDGSCAARRAVGSPNARAGQTGPGA